MLVDSRQCCFYRVQVVIIDEVFVGNAWTSSTPPLESAVKWPPQVEHRFRDARIWFTCACTCNVLRCGANSIVVAATLLSSFNGHLRTLVR